MRHRDLYVKEDASTTKRKVFFGEDKFVAVEKGGRRRIAMPHSLAVYREYGGSPSNVEKYIVAALQTAQMNPCVKMYDIVMRDYLQRQHGVTVENLEEKWRRRCWQCGKTTEKDREETDLKYCSICKMARYCGQECQKKEWKVHKLLHKEIENYAATVMS